MQHTLKLALICILTLSISCNKKCTPKASDRSIEGRVTLTDTLGREIHDYDRVQMTLKGQMAFDRCDEEIELTLQANCDSLGYYKFDNLNYDKEYAVTASYLDWPEYKENVKAGTTTQNFTLYENPEKANIEIRLMNVQSYPVNEAELYFFHNPTDRRLDNLSGAFHSRHVKGGVYTFNAPRREFWVLATYTDPGGGFYHTELINDSNKISLKEGPGTRVSKTSFSIYVNILDNSLKTLRVKGQNSGSAASGTMVYLFLDESLRNSMDTSNANYKQHAGMDGYATFTGILPNKKFYVLGILKNIDTVYAFDEVWTSNNSIDILLKQRRKFPFRIVLNAIYNGQPVPNAKVYLYSSSFIRDADNSEYSIFSIDSLITNSKGEGIFMDTLHSINYYVKSTYTLPNKIIISGNEKSIPKPDILTPDPICILEFK